MLTPSLMVVRYSLRCQQICICNLRLVASTSTTTLLVACTPNGAICYISPVYVGSISDVELTRTCGILDTLADKHINYD